MDPVPGVCQPGAADDDAICPPLSEEEIGAAMSQVKSGRATGLDEISAEVLQLGGATSMQWLKAIADHIWAEEVIPEDWKKQLITQEGL